MTVENLTTARFVLQCLLEELEHYDRCIPVACNVQVGDVADALVTVLNDRRLRRLTAPKTRSVPAPRPSGYSAASRRRRTRAMKNGAPRRAVTMPTCTSPGRAMTRPMMSAIFVIISGVTARGGK